MTGTTRTSAELDPRRRRLLFRAWHRGTREMDLILGTFADSAIDRLDGADLGLFEKILEIDDRDLYRWISGEAPIPAEFDTALFRRIRDYRADGPQC